MSSNPCPDIVDDDAVEVRGYLERPTRKDIVLNGYSLRRIQEDRDRQAEYRRKRAADNVPDDEPQPTRARAEEIAPTVEDLVEAVQRRYPVMSAYELTILRELLKRT